MLLQVTNLGTQQSIGEQAEGPYHNPRSSTSYPINPDPLPKHGRTLTRELASREALEGGDTEKWMKYSMHQFPVSSDETKVEEMETKGWNVSNLQLCVRREHG